MSYGNDQVEKFRRATTYVDRILWRGELPVQAPVKFELVINPKTAKMLGLTVSPTLLAPVDEVINGSYLFTDVAADAQVSNWHNCDMGGR